jgi:pyruvate/2-oxoacid:ferredoxin oxidoreductase beta subunit
MGALKRILVGLIGLFAASAAVAQEMNWVKVTSYLTARDQHAMAYDAARGQVVLFGGVGYSGTLNDTWVWDGTNWVEKTPTTRPSGRYGHAMAYDAARGQVVLFGGHDASGPLSDTWVWDGTNWVQKFPSVNPPWRYGHAMAYDAARGQVVLFGGV